MAVCLAVISKENYPLYIKCGSPENELNFHYTGELVNILSPGNQLWV